MSTEMNALGFLRRHLEARVKQGEDTAAEARGFDFIDDRNFANTGTYRALRAGTLTEVLAVSYSFQSGYATFDVTRGGASLQKFHYTTHAELPAALAFMTNALGPAPATKKRRARGAGAPR